MALQKQSVPINFAQGLDLKTDPNQVPVGKFLVFKNGVFNKGGLFQKRFGFEYLPSLPDNNSTAIDTFKGVPFTTGNSLYAYSQDTAQWLNKGNIVPIQLDVQNLVRTSSSQLTVDIATTVNNLCCTTWFDANGNSYYQIVDANSGSVIVAETQLPVGAVLPRVFIVGRNFIVTYLITITATVHLQFISIPVQNVNNPSAPVDISTQVDSIDAAYDGQTIDGQLYIAWNASDVGGAVRIAYIDQFLTVHSSVAFATHDAMYISITGDITQSSPVVWLSFIDSTGAIYATARNAQLFQIRALTLVASGTNSVNLTSTAINNILTIYYQVENTYSYSSVRSDFIKKITINTAGSVGASSVVLRSVALASKAFLHNSLGYMLVEYGGDFQPSYFLIDQNGLTIAKLAYSNGGGYPINQILSNSLINGDSVQIGYLFKDQLIPVNKTQNVDSVGGLYGQTGINIAQFTFDNKVQALEIGGAIHLNGGYLRMYDGVKPVEHGFFLYPEDLGYTSHTSGGGMSPQQYFYKATYEWTDFSGNIHRSAPSIPLEANLTGQAGTPVTFTSVFTTGQTMLTVSSISGLHVGQIITDSTTGGNLAGNTRITAISSVGPTITIDQATLGNSAGGGDTLRTVDTFSVTVNIPTLRITAKVGVNPVRIVLYRWSVGQQNYFQVTPIQTPVINNTTVDSVTFLDTLSDDEILGNSLIYTTGGVVENISAPACNAMTIYKSRLFLIDAEDANTLWYSKQVLQNTPVEMSDLLTEFIAPSISSIGSTGPALSLFSMDDKLVVFKRDASYYQTGNGPDATGANNDFSEFVLINSTVGCANQDSLAFMPNGIMFQSDKGIWLLGRDLSTSYIGAPVEDFNPATILSAKTIPETNQVRFVLDTGVILMYDYYYGQWGSFEGAPAISSTIYNGKQTLLNSFGKVLQEKDDFYLDGSNPVLISIKTAWIPLSGLQGYQRAYFFYLLAKYLSPHKLKVEIAYDFDPAIKQTLMISPDNFSPNYGGDSLYGSSSPYGGPSALERARVFLEQQKCESFQITITEIYDPSFGVSAGAGLTMSGLNLIIGAKSLYPRLAPKYSVG